MRGRVISRVRQRVQPAHYQPIPPAPPTSRPGLSLSHRLKVAAVAAVVVVAVVAAVAAVVEVSDPAAGAGAGAGAAVAVDALTSQTPVLRVHTPYDITQRNRSDQIRRSKQHNTTQHNPCFIQTERKQTGRKKGGEKEGRWAVAQAGRQAGRQAIQTANKQRYHPLISSHRVFSRLNRSRYPSTRCVQYPNPMNAMRTRAKAIAQN